MSKDNELLNEAQSEETKESSSEPWNSRFGSDETIKNRQYSRTARNQPKKEASGVSKVIVGILVLTVLTPFLLFWLVRSNNQQSTVTPQTASSVMIRRNSETTTLSETTTQAQAVSSVDINNATTEETVTTTMIAPTTAEPVTQAPSTRTHTVQQGETWYGIARQYGVDVNALAAANGTSTASTLYPGNTLIIP